jgi:hypothetical protein
MGADTTRFESFSYVGKEKEKKRRHRPIYLGASRLKRGQKRTYCKNRGILSKDRAPRSYDIESKRKC